MKNNYYKGNAIYNYILQKNYTNYAFVTGNMWQLVYGDKNCIPKFLVLVIGSTTETYSQDFQEKECIAFHYLKQLATAANLPIRIIKFNTEQSEINKIKVFRGLNQVPTEININRFSELFVLLHLPVSKSKTTKYLNDKTSSAYHKWQRNNLGRDLTVSDIDLWQIDSNNKVQTIIELKRSYIDIERWKPYKDDYRNFKLLDNLAKKASMNFKIAYNVRKKNPFFDDISKIKLFNVDFNQKQPIQLEGVYSTTDFFNLTSS